MCFVLVYKYFGDEMKMIVLLFLPLLHYYFILVLFWISIPIS